MPAAGVLCWNAPGTGMTDDAPLCGPMSDLKPGDFVIVECALCGHDGLIHPAALPSLGPGSNERIVDLAPRLRCRECDQKGKAVVAIKWADRYGRGDKILQRCNKS